MPEKLKMHTPDLAAQNIQKLAELFPGCVTEIRDAEGKVTQGIDFDQLRQELSGSIVEGPRERYHLDWPGKREAILAANAPIAKTLRPSRNESVNFDTTKNLFIEGDNLDALKLLQETYLGKVKLIYIDPPYNTGNDFIYDDDYATANDEYLIQSNQHDDMGNRMIANTEANGRFHSSWLTMLYPRLRLARNLLRDDGLIVVSIDDTELSNLYKMCGEVFGDDNFVATVIWQKIYSGKADATHFARFHEYQVFFAKNINVLEIGLLPRTDEMNARYTNPDSDPRGPWLSNDLTAAGERGEGHFPVTGPNGAVYDSPQGKHWLYSKKTIEGLIADNRIWFGTNGTASPRLKRFLSEVQQGRRASTIWTHEEVGHTDEATKELRDIFKDTGISFNAPKPTRLIRRMLEIGTSPTDGDIIVDFFAGSGTTGQAVLQMNKIDGGNRRFVLVQIPQPLNANEGGQQGQFATIADITKERLRRAGVLLTDTLVNGGLDIGFRVLKTDASNMHDVYYAPDAVAQTDLLGQVDNIRPDRTPEDLLFQVLVDWGLDLALPIATEIIEGKQVFFVDQNALAACFDTGVTDEMVKAIAQRKPLRAVFRDSSYGTDSVKINVEQIFKLLSPETEVRSI